MRRLRPFVSFLIVLALYLAIGRHPKLIVFLSPFVFLYAFYVVMISDRIALVFLGISFLILSFWASVETQTILFFALPIFGVILMLTFFLYLRRWDQKIRDGKLRMQSSQQETKALRERYEARIESLAHLEQRVGDLLSLFEIAKDFNECLSFSELLAVLEKKISPHLKFARGMLVLFASVSEGKGRRSQILSFGPKKRMDQGMNQQFADACIRFAQDSEQLVRLETASGREDDPLVRGKAEWPVWVFPLCVERERIALLAIEGGRENDLPVFEILASQLSLQIKKIRLYEMVKEVSIIDGLTGVFVRRHFFERFQEELKRAARYRFPLSVLMVDVDDFKSYNDEFGHLVGDRTLKEVAHVIRENVRRVDVIGRYGGEEFIIVSPEIEKRKGVELAERIRSSVARKHFSIYDVETRVTLSIGVSSFPEDLSSQQVSEHPEVEVRELIEKADQALYRAKEEGRNRVGSYT